MVSENFSANKPMITSKSRVLHIGDSHSCGIYGKTLHELMRATGATVRTCAVAGSSPIWWLNETIGNCGYYACDERGNVDQPADWQTPRITPNLNSIISEYKPDLVIFSLGANLAYSSPGEICSQVKSVCEPARQAGCRIVWVGPPEPRPGIAGAENYALLYENLKESAEKYGIFVDSRPLAKYPATGGDGLHYSGPAGTKIAQEWANQVMTQVQKNK